MKSLLALLSDTASMNQSQSQSVFVRARENPKHKQTAQRRLLIIIYINKISNAISVTPCLSSELSS